MEGVVWGLVSGGGWSCRMKSGAYICRGLGQPPDVWLGDKHVCQPTLARWDEGCGGGLEERGLRRCPALTRAERTAKCHIVSPSLPNSPFLLPSFYASMFHHNLLLNKNTTTGQSSFQGQYEWISDLFLNVFLTFCKNSFCPFLHAVLNLFTTSASLIQTFTQSCYQTFSL